MNNVFFSSDFHGYHKNIVRGVSTWDDKSGCRDFDTLEEHNEVLIQNINNIVKRNDVLYFLGDWTFGGNHTIKKFRDRIYCGEIHIIRGNHDGNIKGEHKENFSAVRDYYKKTINGQEIIMSHYPMVVWDRHHHGSWQLHGHCHGSLPPSHRKTLDVGVDTNNLIPYHFDEIKEIMDNRVIDFLDHHNSSTN